jgi:hypothetical protein
MIEAIFLILIAASVFGAIQTGVWALIGYYFLTYLCLGVIGVIGFGAFALRASYKAAN